MHSALYNYLYKYYIINYYLYLTCLGLSTSTAALYALFAILTAKPGIQEKAREEVDRVLQGRQPTLKDRDTMPYIQAMLEETLRYAVIVPVFVHKATQDSSLHGFPISKGTQVHQANLDFFF